MIVQCPADLKEQKEVRKNTGVMDRDSTEQLPGVVTRNQIATAVKHFLLHLVDLVNLAALNLFFFFLKNKKNQ